MLSSMATKTDDDATKFPFINKKFSGHVVRLSCVCRIDRFPVNKNDCMLEFISNGGYVLLRIESCSHEKANKIMKEWSETDYSRSEAFVSMRTDTTISVTDTVKY